MSSLPQNELVEFDRVCEVYQLTRSQAMREAIRQYIAADTRRIPVVDPESGELEAIARGEKGISRGEYVTSRSCCMNWTLIVERGAQTLLTRRVSNLHPPNWWITLLTNRRAAVRSAESS
jgi:predicted transcriptional regulator